ncbi:MAG: hypothetical protein QM831_04385 [Kofleriaceae bacterium]
MDSIKAALEAARQDQWRLALDHLLAAWRDNPAPEIVAAFDAIEVRARETTWPIAAPASSYLDVWLSAIPTADAAQLSVLIAAIDTVSDRVRLRLLYALRPYSHPRFADRIARMIANGSPEMAWRPPTPRMHAEWSLVTDISKELAANEPRGTDRKTCTGLVQLARERIADREVYLATLARLVERARLESTSANAWLALADYLQQHGDPRGEWIALELATRSGRRLKRVATRRLQALRRTYRLTQLVPTVAAITIVPDTTLQLGGPIELPDLLRLLDDRPIDRISIRVPLAKLGDFALALAKRPAVKCVEMSSLATGSVGQRFTFRRSRAGELSSLTVRITGDSYLISQPAIDVVTGLPEDMLQYIRIEQSRGEIAAGFHDAARRQVRLRRFWRNGVLA